MTLLYCFQNDFRRSCTKPKILQGGIFLISKIQYQHDLLCTNIFFKDRINRYTVPFYFECNKLFSFQYRFDSKFAFSRSTVLISPSRNRRNGWMKVLSAAAMNSRSIWPSNCSACPTLINVPPYAPSCPYSPPAWEWRISNQQLLKKFDAYAYYIHIDAYTVYTVYILYIKKWEQIMNYFVD